ncbi:hypothetical protein LOCC1_G004861 [Lachnellula occidentalis]|uniref:3'-5' exonuclease domain-containing protein n=1 Tax=Lachnellula occidentalis TaxID=215460 RepID=A0A8H8UG51_9HELO|nr:hypothetical protein LOCC1_G004861 [Lachnellula occidentalis]
MNDRRVNKFLKRPASLPTHNISHTHGYLFFSPTAQNITQRFYISVGFMERLNFAVCRVFLQLILQFLALFRKKEEYTGGDKGKGREKEQEPMSEVLLNEFRDAKRTDNHVGRSPGFWRIFVSPLADYFPTSQDILNYLKMKHSIEPKTGFLETSSKFSPDHQCESSDKRSLAIHIRLKDDGRNAYIQGYLTASIVDTLRCSDSRTSGMVVPYEFLKTAADFASELGDIYQLVDTEKFSATSLCGSKQRQETEPVMLWIPRVLPIHLWHSRPSPSNRLPRQLLPAFNGDVIIGTSKYWKNEDKGTIERPIPARKLSPWRRVTWVHNHADMLDFVPQILEMAKSGIELACDCEGTATGLSGKDGMTHFTMTSRTLGHTWVFRTQWIPGMFDIPGGEGQTLRSLLESETVVQLWFDVRNDANAMFGVEGIRLGNVLDVQLMEGATRCGPRLRLQSLKRCVQIEGRQFMEHEEYRNWLNAKTLGHEYFTDHTWGVLEWRELPDEVMRYTAGDAACLFGLKRIYTDRMPSVASALKLDSANTLMQMVEEASKVRFIESISDNFGADDLNRQAKRFLPAPICDLEEVGLCGGEGVWPVMVYTKEWMAEFQQENEPSQRELAAKMQRKKERKEKSAKLLKCKLKNKRMRKR